MSWAFTNRTCEVRVLDATELLSINRPDSEKEATDLVVNPPPIEEVSSLTSPADVEVTVDLCPVVPKQTETMGNPSLVSQTPRHRHTSSKKPTSVMYLIPIDAHHRGARGHRTPGHASEASPQNGSDSTNRRTILKSQTPAPADRSERMVKDTAPSSTQVRFATDAKAAVSQRVGKQSEGKVLPATINDKGRTAATQDQTHASMQLLMRYTKEMEGKRLRNERLRQKNSLHFGYQALRWMAISHSVTFICATVIVLALVKG